MLGVQRIAAESGQRIPVNQRAQRFVIDGFDLLDLVRGAETVKKVQYRHPAVDRREVRNRTQIHDLLR